MARSNRRSHLNIPMCLASVLFCLTMVSVYMVSGLYARYTTSGSSEDSARVIRFGDITLTQTGATCSTLVIPGVDIPMGLSVSFTGSESATYVFLEVDSESWVYADGTFSQNGQLSWELADGWTNLEGTTVFYRSLDPNDTLSDVPVIWGSTITVSDTITRDSIEDLEDTLSFQASVVQSNGFANADAAWDSLSRKGGAA